jgi:hypothetical protein
VIASLERGPGLMLNVRVFDRDIPETFPLTTVVPEIAPVKGME